MSKSIYSGNYTKAFLSTKVSPSDSIEQSFYNELIEVGEGEGCYIYSFKENKLIFSKGLDVMFGIVTEEVNMVLLNSIYEKEFTVFVDEYYDRLLLYLYNNNKQLKDFSSSIIIKVKDYEFPVYVNIKVLKTDANGNLVSIIGIVKRMAELKTTNVVQYSLKGVADQNFTDKVNFGLDHNLCISEDNIKLIELIEKDETKETISKTLSTSTESIQNRLKDLYRRFNVNSEKDLVEFAKTNFIIPNQFEIFNL